MCGMITRTAKSRVAANRNMELTLLLTEQKHMLGYVLNEADWLSPQMRRSHAKDASDSESEFESESGHLEGDIEDEDGNLSLLKAFKHRISVSRPEAVRGAIRTPGQRFHFVGRAKSRPLRGVEGQRLREFMARLHNYDRNWMTLPTSICLWRWCKYRTSNDNKKDDFKVTSQVLKRGNNSRNASFVAYRNTEGQREYAEVQFFFNTRLPLELRTEGPGNDPPGLADSNSDSDNERNGTALHHLAYIRKISVELECEDSLVRRVGSGGALAVISAGSIECLIGRLKVQNDEYLTARFTSFLGRM